MSKLVRRRRRREPLSLKCLIGKVYYLFKVHIVFAFIQWSSDRILISIKHLLNMLLLLTSINGLITGKSKKRRNFRAALSYPGGARAGGANASDQRRTYQRVTSQRLTSQRVTNRRRTDHPYV